VLLSDVQTPSLEEIRLRASFASIIPASPTFESLRSAAKIGCSFAGSPAQLAVETDDQKAQETFRCCKILVADDNRTNQMVLDTILSNAGHEVVIAQDGEEALSCLETQRFDIAFLDVNMPRLGGVEAAKIWRTMENPRHRLPIIALTADSTSETEQKCLRAGMDMRLNKPVESTELLRIIAEVVQPRDAQLFPAGSEDIEGRITPIKPIENPRSQPALAQEQIDYLQSIGGDDFLRAVLEGYLEDTSTVLAQFQMSVENDDVKDFRFHAHAFKSSAGNIGARTLYDYCATLEVIPEADFVNRGKLHLQKVIEQVEQIETEIRTILHDSNPARNIRNG
jgi:two-component system sensor histidine kinase RpfC